MSFFKKYNGTTDLRLARLEKLIWVLIYGGLLSVVLSFFIPDEPSHTAVAMLVGGCILTAVGVGMLYYRSRLHQGH
jgi:uncharacterized membrane protein